jgi:stage III sporulation protein AD
MDLIVKIAAVGIVSAAAGLVIKRHNPESSLLLSICASALIMAAALEVFGSLLDFVGELAADAGISSALFLPVIKTAGIGITGRLASDICKEAGQAAAASAAELAAAIAALYAALPLLKALMVMICSFL